MGMETVRIPVTGGKVDESWLGSVLADNAARSIRGDELSPEFGAMCIRFTDVVLCDANLGFKNFDKVTKAEVCSIVYAHLCSQVGKYDPESGTKPSNWVYTVVKNRMIQAVKDVVRSRKVSDIVSAVVGSETLAKMSSIDRNAPANRILSEKVAALAGFQLDRKAKESIFGQVWRDSWFRRDNRTLSQRARKHGRAHAASVARQCSVDDGGRAELLQLLEERKNGRS